MFCNRRICLVITFLLIRAVVFSQVANPNEYVEEKPPLMKGEIAFGLNVHTSGTIGLQFRKAKNLTGYKKFYWETDLVGMKHPKEIKSVNRYFTDADRKSTRLNSSHSSVSRMPSSA